jgi:hypothetical protein
MNRSRVQAVREHAAYQASADWRHFVPLDDVLPEPRSGHATVICQDQMWVFGGFCDNACLDSLWCFEAGQLKWRRVANTQPWPAARCSTALCLDGRGGMILYGGSGPAFGASTMIDLWRFDLAAQTWKQLFVRPNGCGYHVPFGRGDQQQACFENPKPVYGHAMVPVPGTQFALLFAGTTGAQYTNRLHALNLESFEFTLLNTTGPAPSERYLSACFMLNEGKRMLVIGGGQHLPKYSDRLQVFELDLATLHWTAIECASGLPHARIGCAINRIGPDEFLLFGGRTDKGAMMHQLNDSWRYLARQRAWARVQDTAGLAPRDFLSGGLVAARRVFLFGGFDGQKRLGEMLVRDLDWAAPPSLEVLCMRQFCKMLVREQLEAAWDWSDVPEHLVWAIEHTHGICKDVVQM